MVNTPVPQAAPQPPRTVPLTDAARLLGVSYDRLHRGVTRGAIPAKRAPLSNRYFVAVADLPAIAAACGVAFDATSVLP